MKRALLIGINYINTTNELKGCIEDVNNMKNALITAHGFSEKDIVVMTDDVNQAPEFVPNKQNIVKHMSSLLDNVCEGDTLVLHYSGHGTQVKDSDGDELDHLDDALVPQDFMKNGLMTDDSILLDFVKKVPKGVTLYVFLDCCHSGSLFDLKWNFKYSSPRKNLTDTLKWGDEYIVWRENKNVLQGTVMMYSGCYDEQTSADAFIASKSQGAFTFCLLDILAKSNGELKNCDLLKEVNANLYLQGFEQRSQFSCSDIELFDTRFFI